MAIASASYDYEQQSTYHESKKPEPNTIYKKYAIPIAVPVPERQEIIIPVPQVSLRRDKVTEIIFIMISNFIL